MQVPLKAVLLVFTISVIGAIVTYFGLTALLGANTGPVVMYTQPMANKNLDIIAKAPDFEYTNAFGKPFSSASLAGKIWVADFFFTSCPGICATMMKNMAKQAEHFRGKPVEFVGFSVDPETDTPERMKAYGDKYGADPEVWHLLTGPFEETARLSHDVFMLGTLDGPMDHSARMVLVDAMGNIRGYFSGIEDEDQRNLTEAIEHLLEEMEQDER